MPGTELRSSVRRHRTAGAPQTHLLDHESPPGPRRPPESYRPVAGGSSCISRERPSRLPAGTSRSRAAVRRLAAGLLLVVAGLLGVSAAAQAQTPIPVTIEAEYERIGGGLEDLDFELTREGETTDELDVTVTIVQDESWLGDSDLSHDVTFLADEATAELTIVALEFSLAPSTTGDLTATVVGDGISGGSESVEIISISEPPFTISYDMAEYTFAENDATKPIYAVATLNVAYPRAPSGVLSLHVSSGDLTIHFSAREGTAGSPEDYTALSLEEPFNRDEWRRDADTDQFVARMLLSDHGFAIENDDSYEGPESFGLIMEPVPGRRMGIALFQKPDGTTCDPTMFGSCPNPPFQYSVHITDEGDRPELSLSVDPASIAEEDDDATMDIAENVSTVTVEITNGKTFARDTTVTLAFSGTATQGTHYGVSPADADMNEADHQVLLPKETASVEVIVTATTNATADGPRTVTVTGDLGGTAIGSGNITILDDESTPGAPTGLTATASGSTTIDLTWTEPSSDGGYAITGYKIEASPNGTSNWTGLVANTSSTVTTYSHTGLDPGTTRHYRVSAINDNGTGTASNIDDATTGTTVPGAPTGLSATASGSTTINLTWTAPSGDGGSAITGYKIEVSPNGTSNWTDRVANTNSTTTTYSHTGLDPGTTRHYRVSAINANGTGPASNIDGATTGTTVPGAPTGLSATASGSTTINLTWTAPSGDGGSAITGYKIEVSPNGNSSWTDREANTGTTTTTYSHTGLDAGATHHYRVSAINANGTGPASNIDDATTGTTVPSNPLSLFATASGSTTIDLAWNAPTSDGGSPITGYRIQVSPNLTSGWTNLVANTATTGTTYSDTGRAAGTTRYYRVAAINANGTSNFSNIDGATTGTAVPGAPTSLTATASGSTTINLAWTAPSGDGGSAITGYKIEVSPNGTSNWTDRVANTSSTTTTYSHTGLDPGTTRHYRVSAINANGTGPASNIDDATTGTTVPSNPLSLFATASGSTTIDLSWNAPSRDGGSPITGYRIQVSPNLTSGWTNLVANTATTGTTYSDTGRAAGTTRYYRVAAINANGTGNFSNIDGATTGTAVPGAPTSLTATANGSTQIDLSWTAPADNGGSPISGYRIEVSSDGGSSWTDLVADTDDTNTTYEDRLPAGTTRHYRVSAINANGTGTASNVDDATTTTTVPGAPTSLTATASGTSTIDLSWTAPSNDGGSAISGYRIEVSSDGGSSWIDLVADTDDTNTTYEDRFPVGTTRHYRVSAINANGTGAASNVATLTVPGAPTGLTATASGTSTINLSWTAPADDGGASISGYRIEVSSDGGSSWIDLVVDTDDTNTTYEDRVPAGSTRHYRVSAINSVGTGAASNVDDATTDDATTTVPGAPTGLTATASGTSTINLTWDAPSNDGGASISGYRIEVSSNGGTSWTNLVGNVGSTTYAHTGLDAGTTRHYRVSAINAVGTGTASNVDDATTGTTVPGAPTNLSATASGSTTIDLAWNAPTSDGGSSITGYKIEVSSDATSWSDLVANTNSTGRTYSHTGLTAGDTRHYRVSAINSVGTGAASNVDDATTDDAAATVPGAPTSLTATPSGTTRIDLSWTAPTDNGGSDISGYRIEVSSNGGTSWTNREGNTGSSTTTYSHTGLSAGTTRHYRVSAINSVGTGTASNVDNATTDDDDQPGLAVVTVHRLATSVPAGGLARFELRRSGGDLGWLKVSYRHEESDGNYVRSWGYFKPGVTVKGADYYVGGSSGRVTARVTGPSNPLCTPNDAPSASCTDNYTVGNPSSASMQVTATASARSSADALEDALTLVDGLTPDVAAAVLLGQQTLGEAELAALDRLGNGNGRYDLGDLLSWIERCRRGEARCGPTSTGSGPPPAAGLLAAAAAGRPWISRRTRRRGSGRPGRKSIRAARRRGRFAGYALATLLAVTMTLSCTEGSVGPAANVQDPGFLTVEWTGPAAGRGIGVLLELEGPGIEAVRAPGFELYESRASGRHEIVVAGSLRAGPLVQFRVPDRGQLPLYRVRVLEVAGEDYELRDAGQYRAVITLH